MNENEKLTYCINTIQEIIRWSNDLMILICIGFIILSLGIYFISRKLDDKINKLNKFYKDKIKEIENK